MANTHSSPKSDSNPARLSHTNQTAIRYDLEKVCTALTYDNAVQCLPRAYADTCVSIIGIDPDASFTDNLNQYFTEEFAKIGPLQQHVHPTRASALVSRLRDAETFFAQYLAAPTAYGLPPRHIALLQNINLLNGRLFAELADWHPAATEAPQLNHSQLKSTLDNLWQEFDVRLFTLHWNSIVSQLEQSQQFTPALLKTLEHMTAFLTEKLSYEKTLDSNNPESNATFLKLYTDAKHELAELNEAHYSFLLNQLASLQHPQLSEGQSALALQRHHQTLAFMLNAHSREVKQETRPKVSSQKVDKPFSIPDRITTPRQLDNLVSTLKRTAEVDLAHNAPLIYILFERCSGDTKLHKRLLALTLKQHESLRRTFHIDSQREHFQHEISMHFWMQQLLVALCQYRFNTNDDSVKQAESIDKFTKDVLAISQSDSSPIERMYRVMDKMASAKLLESSAQEYLRPLVKQVPGLEHLDNHHSSSTTQAMTIFRESLPFAYLKTQSKPALCSADDLTILAKHSSAPDVVSLCKRNQSVWRGLSQSKQQSLKTTLLNKLYAHTPFDFAQKQFGATGSVPTARLWDWDRLKEWYDGCRTQQIFTKATAEDQCFLTQEHKAAEQRMARHKSAFLQNVLNMALDTPTDVNPMTARSA